MEANEKLQLELVHRESRIHELEDQVSESALLIQTLRGISNSKKKAISNQETQTVAVSLSEGDSGNKLRLEEQLREEIASLHRQISQIQLSDNQKIEQLQQLIASLNLRLKDKEDFIEKIKS